MNFKNKTGSAKISYLSYTYFESVFTNSYVTRGYLIAFPPYIVELVAGRRSIDFLDFAGLSQTKQTFSIMGGIKDLLGFHFWLDNNKRGALESLLANQKQIPKDRQSILKDLAFEAASFQKNNLKKIGAGKAKP